MNEEERFDPSRHNLADAAARLKQISEKDYTARLAEVLGRHEEEDTNELATGGVIENGGIAYVADGAGSTEIIHTPRGAQVVPKNATNMYVGDVPWQNIPPPPPWANPPLYVPPVTIGTSTEPLTPERLEELMSKQHIRVVPAPVPEITEERLREIVAETIKKVLYPEQDGLVTHQHRRVRQWDENGDEWRGVLYKVDIGEEKYG